MTVSMRMLWRSDAAESVMRRRAGFAIYVVSMGRINSNLFAADQIIALLCFTFVQFAAPWTN